ncbi:NADP-binding protein [Dacryopinax primogenitus]|uniref:NADP-binding protein n=1 Tax=Dacryopinax primogenitus (strain DJM 731) TaxID=1858805 RepID=M5FUH7_DACPD|nr:NADP-binding protein [Dacryopinax primogenitus]EJU01396.1 NADP-binding protein [Dacryopinax primogenitus]
MSKKIVVVTGATGKQGGSVVSALLRHGGYTVRGLMRNLHSALSRELTAQGAEMVQASLMEKDSLIHAFKGAYAVFGVTVPAEESDFEQGKNMVDACLANKVDLFVWSSLPSSSELSNGKYPMRFWDDKYAVDKYIKAVGQPSVIFMPGSFTENLISFGQLKPVASDTWEIQYPVATADYVQPFLYVEKDLGEAVTALIDHWDDADWKERLTKDVIQMSSYNITGGEMAGIIARITGRDVSYVLSNNVPDFYKTMWEFCVEYWPTPEAIPSKVLLDLGIKFHTFEDYVREKLVPFMNAA